MNLQTPSVLLLAFFCFNACKKSNDSNPSDTFATERPGGLSVVYKTQAIIASPTDSLHLLFRDSMVTNGYTGFVHANISNIANGFSFGYADPSKSLPFFGFAVPAFPNVPRHFTLNKAYENVLEPGNLYQYAAFLGTPDGFTGMTYFVNNVYPPDAGSPSSKTYTSVIFTKRIKVPVNNNTDTLIFASGHIEGYKINYFHLTDTSKYVQRWNFTVDFTNLGIAK